MSRPRRQGGLFGAGLRRLGERKTGLRQSDGAPLEKKRNYGKISLDMGRVFYYYVWACGGEGFPLRPATAMNREIARKR